MENVSVRDNGGNTADRYTITFWDHDVTVSSSENPTHPMGVWSWVEFRDCDSGYLDYCRGDYDDLEDGDSEYEDWANLRESVGPEIEWDVLSEQLRTYLVSWVATLVE